jgi:N-acetylglucosamine-6-phosphate deacetylase
MHTTCVKNARVIRPGEGADVRSLIFGDRIIIGGESAAAVVDGADQTLTPGLIDLHTHGIGPYLYERSGEDLVGGLKMLPRFGVTSVLPTLYSVLKSQSLPLVEKLGQALSKARGGARAPGFHLEGPFLALAGAGGMTLGVDLIFLRELIAACGGKVVAMSLSPEVPGILAVIEHLIAEGIAPFITHTRASAEQTQRAIDAGARHATHFYDVFPLPQERDAGVRPVGAVEVLLGHPRASVDFICDGVHVHPAAIRAALAAKGAGGIVAITDSNIGAGLPDGTYDTPWGYRVHLTESNAARVADADHPSHGLLAGSGLTLNRAVKNLRAWLDLPEEQIWAMTTSNPARVANLAGLGVIQGGVAADLVLWRDDLTPSHTWVAGELVYTDERNE